MVADGGEAAHTHTAAKLESDSASTVVNALCDAVNVEAVKKDSR